MSGAAIDADRGEQQHRIGQVGTGDVDMASRQRRIAIVATFMTVSVCGVDGVLAQTASLRAFKGPGWYALFQREDGGYDWPGAAGDAGPYQDTDKCFAAAKKLEDADKKSGRANPRLADCMLLNK